jgi:CheY-like chemotaxis protein
MRNQPPLVLVVEDEPLMRMNVADALQSEGLEVIELANGDDALRVIESRSDVRAIFTDINMPGAIDGLRLVKLIKEAWPDIAIFVATGRPDPALVSKLPPGARLYPKPYRVSDVVEAIKSATG